MKVLLEVLVDTSTGDWVLYRAKEQVPNAGSDTLVGYRELNMDDEADEAEYLKAASALLSPLEGRWSRSGAVPRWVPCGTCGAGDGQPHDLTKHAS